MTKGVILFAFNSPKFNYYEMAKFTAKRVNHFLNLPVTLITDEESLPKEETYVWDNIVKVIPNKNNKRSWGQWINKGRYQSFELSPYDETLLLDVDYMVNSSKLASVFNFYDDFCCHNSTSFMMFPNAPQTVLSEFSRNTLWATVVAFKKTKRAKQIFQMMEMVQNNYNHYANVHGFISAVFRNDYALTIALNTVNGHITPISDYIPWNLVHVSNDVKVIKNSDTEFTLMSDVWKKGKMRKEYIVLKDMDFHMMGKENFEAFIHE